MRPMGWRYLLHVCGGGAGLRPRSAAGRSNGIGGTAANQPDLWSSGSERDNQRRGRTLLHWRPVLQDPDGHRGSDGQRAHEDVWHLGNLHPTEPWHVRSRGIAIWWRGALGPRRVLHRFGRKHTTTNDPARLALLTKPSPRRPGLRPGGRLQLRLRQRALRLHQVTLSNLASYLALRDAQISRDGRLDRCRL